MKKSYKKTGFDNGKRTEIKNILKEQLSNTRLPYEIYSLNLGINEGLNGKINKSLTLSTIKEVVNYDECPDKKALDSFLKILFHKNKGRPTKFIDDNRRYKIKSENELQEIYERGLLKTDKHGIKYYEYLNIKPDDVHHKNGENFVEHLFRHMCANFRVKPTQMKYEIDMLLGITEFFKQMEKFTEEERKQAIEFMVEWTKWFYSLSEKERKIELELNMKKKSMFNFNTHF